MALDRQGWLLVCLVRGKGSKLGERGASKLGEGKGTKLGEGESDWALPEG